MVRQAPHREDNILHASLAPALRVVIASIFSRQAIRPKPDLKRTAAGEVRQLALADGSRVTLDGGTAVDIDLAGDARRVRLYRGEVYVEVAPGGKPFVVIDRDAATRLGVSTVGAVMRSAAPPAERTKSTMRRRLASLMPKKNAPVCN